MGIIPTVLSGTYITVAIVSFILNMLLIFLIKTKTASAMKQYGTILLQVCVVNIVAGFVYGIVQFEFEVVQGWMFMRSAAPWFDNVGIWPAVLTWFHVVVLMTQFWLIPLQSVFRYFVIVKKKSLRPVTTVIWILGITAFAMIISTINLIPIFDPSSSKNNYLILQYLHNYDDDPTVLISFRSVYMLDPYILAFCGIYFTATTASVFLLIISTIKTHRHLKSIRCHMTQKTITMHREFGIRLLIQSLIPILIFIFYIFMMIMVFLGPSEKIRGRLFSMGVLPFTWISFLDPLITIVTIKSYRIALIKNFYSNHSIKDPSQTQNNNSKRTTTAIVS